MNCTEKGGRHLLQERREAFRFIKENAKIFPVEKMCKVLNVSSSSYYYWRKHPVGSRQQTQNQLVSHIRRVHTESQCRYGSPRITDELREQGVKASRNRIARLMQKAGIRSIIYKKYRVQTTDSNHNYPVAKNLLNRDFTAEKPGQK
ncbi:IS3 family transposase [Spirosoma sp. BT702]|uniref:IS3 family transposase n=1 Tax=Spirosoma profusum TaxID=2771354 RepID=A0A927AVL5_9BACT|nr:IS3 family transposase [Spirosoma profusum]MBD2705240.1 IS3 family transposase [Spirosoma profusum]